MKKIISLSLIAVMLIANIFLATPIHTQAATSILAWDFENGDLSAVGTPDGADADGYYAAGDVSLVPGGANGSNYSMKISGANSGNGQWLWNLKGDTDYELTFYAKIENWGGASYPNIGVSGYNGDAYQTVAAFSGLWTKYSISFRTGAESNCVQIYTWIYGEGAVDFYIDNVQLQEVQETHPINNWDFEYNDLSKIGTPDGSDADGYYAVGDVSIVADGANGSSYAMKISGANCGNGQWLWGLKQDTEYEVTFWAKIANWGGSAYPAFGVNGYDGDAYVAEGAFTEEWKQFNLIFRTGKESTIACIYTWINGSGAVDFYIDNVQVSEVVVEEDVAPIERWNFENGNVNSLGTPDGNDEDGYYAVADVSVVAGGANDSAYALKISGANSGNGQWLWDLKQDTEYEVTFWAKIANWGGSAYPTFGVNGYDGDAYVAESAFTEEWKQFNLVFRTGKESTIACIYTWIHGSGAVDFYIDNVQVSEVVVEEDVAPIERWNFENGNVNSLGTPDGNDEDGYYAVADVSVVAGGANDSAYALKISSANSGNGQWLWDLQKDTQYEVTFWAKIANWGGSAYPSFGVNGYDGDAYVAESAFTEEWKQFNLVFRTGKESTIACIYTWIHGSGAVDFYIDNVTITAIDQNPMKDWNFEHNDLSALGTPDSSNADGYYAAGDISIVAGGANDSAYALKISGANSGNGQWLYNLQKDTEYEVSFYAKIANWGGSAYPNFGINGYNGDAYVSEGSFGVEWAKYTLRFRTGVNSTSACIYTWIYGTGDVDFYIDDVTVKTAPQGTIAQCNVTLSDKIGLNIYASIPENEVSAASFEITHNDVTTTYYTADAINKDGYYVFSVRLAAAQMTDVITAKLLVDGVVVDEGTYSVEEYGRYILNDTQNVYDDATKALVKEMLNYGAAAQEFFAYNQANCVDEDLIAGAAATDVPTVAAADLSVSGKVEGVVYYGASLVCEDSTAVRFYFTADDLAGITFKSEDKTLEVVAKDDLYYVEISEILPQNLDQQITLVVCDDAGNSMEVAYGPMNYMVRMNAKGSDLTKQLVKALYNYYLAARDYSFRV